MQMNFLGRGRRKEEGEGGKVSFDLRRCYNKTSVWPGEEKVIIFTSRAKKFRDLSKEKNGEASFCFQILERIPEL